MQKNSKIVFFGTPAVATQTLQALVDSGYEIVLVVSQSDKPAGRGQELRSSPVKALAQKLGLKVLEDYNSLSSVIEKIMPDLGIVVIFGRIVPQKVINLFPQGILNIHPSLLPKYRGPSPIQGAILNGDDFSGVSVIKIDSQVDHGPILAQTRHKLSGQETGEELYHELFRQGINLLIKTLPDYLTGKLRPIEQDHAKATFTKILIKEDGLIDFKLTTEEIARQVRAFQPWPGSYFMDYTFGRVRLIKVLASEDFSQDKIGQLFKKNDQLQVNCSKGSLIIKELQLDNKRPVTDREFINGYLAN